METSARASLQNGTGEVALIERGKHLKLDAISIAASRIRVKRPLGRSYAPALQPFYQFTLNLARFRCYVAALVSCGRSMMWHYGTPVPVA
jgi:hypothetical protein